MSRATMLFAELEEVEQMLKELDPVLDKEEYEQLLAHMCELECGLDDEQMIDEMIDDFMLEDLD